jgi:ubiquitin-like-conjugating enzyme ATG10
MLSRELFEQSCSEFVSNTKIQQLGWKWNIGDRSQGYLSMCCEKELDLDFDELNTEDITEYTEEEDVGVVNRPVQKLTKFEYHVAYSIVFNVPVLYFNIYHDNKVLRYDQIMKAFVEKKRKERHHLPEDLNMYTFITQGEHPVLNKIFFYVHPCQTADLCKLVGYNTSANYISSWLSFTGQCIELYLPILHEIKID